MADNEYPVWKEGWQCVNTRKAKRGIGTKKDPVREVTQYWDFDGNFLAEMDAEHCMVIIEHDTKAVKESI